MVKQSSIPYRSSGFTLIELLIVVAIISILAAIAVPNYLEAQVRGKVAKVISNQRTMAMALEVYSVDENEYPPWYMIWGGYRWAGFPIFHLTTPVAHLTSEEVANDVFSDQGHGGAYMSWYRTAGSGAFCWHENNCVREKVDYDSRGNELRNPPNNLPLGRSTPYVIIASGPRQYVLPGAQGLVMYDASNGTISNGNILRLGP